jgi:integrase
VPVTGLVVSQVTNSRPLCVKPALVALPSPTTVTLNGLKSEVPSVNRKIAGHPFNSAGRGRELLPHCVERRRRARRSGAIGERPRRARGERFVPPTKVSFAELSEAWLASKTRVGAWTRRGFRDALDNLLLPRFGDWQIAAIDADSIAKLIRELEREGLHAIDPKRPKRPLSASSIVNYLKPLAGTLDLAVRRRMIGSNPYRTLVADERPQQRDSKAAYEWSDEEIGALLRAATELAARKDAKFNYEPIIRTAVYTGLRLGELLGLCWRHIDPDERVLHVEQQWTLTHQLTPPKTKNGVRRVPLTPGMVGFFRELKLASRFSQPDDFVFASLSGKPLQHRNVQTRGFEPARDLAGLPESLTFHSLRHAFASMAAHRTVPIEVLSAALGHGDTSITQKVYLHLFNRERAEDAFRRAMGGA